MKHLKMVLIAFILGTFSLSGHLWSAEVMRYQVVGGSEDKAYLVDTVTGQVWVLTHRTLPTGREPIAIPYKFIKISPKQQNEFLLEKVQETSITEGEK